MPELTGQNVEFVKDQQNKVKNLIKKTSSISGIEEQKNRTFKDGIENVNNIKNMVMYDEWETYSIKFSIFEPFEDPKVDVRLQGNH